MFAVMITIKALLISISIRIHLFHGHGISMLLCYDVPQDILLYMFIFSIF